MLRISSCLFDYLTEKQAIIQYLYVCVVSDVFLCMFLMHYFLRDDLIINIEVFLSSEYLIFFRFFLIYLFLK